MGLFDYFRRKPAIRTPEDLAAFIDEQSAFLVQKGIYEYSRARAGHYSKVLFAESGFHDAVNASRWKAYPLGLAMVGEMAEGALANATGIERRVLVEAIRDLVLAVFDRYPSPPSLDAADWRARRDELALRLERMVLHPPKPPMDIPEPYAEAYFDLMPIHEKLRGRDAPTMHSYLRITMTNISDLLTSRMDAPALVAALVASQPLNAR